MYSQPFARCTLMHGRSLPPLVVDPLKSELLDDAVWDFSQQWTGDDRSGASVHVYGDPLLSETVAGRRSWYGIYGDSIFYNGEEDRLTTIVAERPVYMVSGPLIPGSGKGGLFLYGSDLLMFRGMGRN